MPVFPAVPSTTVPPGRILEVISPWRVQHGRRGVQALFLGVKDDSDGGTVLDAAPRILKLGLAKDVASGLFREGFEVNLLGFVRGQWVDCGAHQRCVSHGLCEAMNDGGESPATHWDSSCTKEREHRAEKELGRGWDLYSSRPSTTFLRI